jgi:hypothetical protein
MIIHCHKCGDTVSPNLPDLLEFDATAICGRCAGENLRQQEGGDSGPPETGPGPPPVVVDLDGRRVVPMKTSPDAIGRARAMADVLRLDMLREFNEQLPLFRDAYLAMTRAGRQAFRCYVEAVVGLHEAEDEEAFANPLCLFRVPLVFCRLDPADSHSGYAGHYLGRDHQELLFPKALAAAAAAWDEGRDFRIDTLDDLRRYE